MTRGGSFDRAGAIVEAIYGYPRPFSIPYEWLLIGGKKMASSKGVGVPAADFAELLRPGRPGSRSCGHYRQAVTIRPARRSCPTMSMTRRPPALRPRADPDLVRTFLRAPGRRMVDVYRMRFRR
jgi:hypothetical protein